MQNSKLSIQYLVGRYWLFNVALSLVLLIWVFNLNQPLFYAINQMHTILPNVFWSFINHLTYTKYWILPIMLFIVTYIFRRDKLRLLVLLYISNFLILSIIKSLAHEARPFIVLSQDTFFWLKGAEDIAKTAYKSFPSGHVGNVAIFVFTLKQLFLKHSHLSRFNQSQLKTYLYALLILTCLSRICTGWHWPLDVLASCLIGYVLVEVFFNLKFFSKVTNI